MSAHSDRIPLEEGEAKLIYSPEDLALLDQKKIPQHIAIMMDGNRRWAKQRGLPLMMGHWEGAETLTDIIRAASELGVKTLTVYSFSTENWRRPDEEIEALMNIFELYLIRKKEVMVKEGVKLGSIGDLSMIPQRVQDAFYNTQKATENSDKINLILALNYGGRDELRRAMIKAFQKMKKDRLSLESLTEEMISSCLDTNPWGDPDLVIRTSGELRVSNFLLWQISYSEFFITDVLWPDFSSKTLLEAVLAYQGRYRRLGGAC